MGRIKYEPVAQLRHSFLNLGEKWGLGLLVILIDLIFLTIFGFVYKLYFDRIMIHATNIMQQTGSMTTALQSQDIYSAAPIAQTLSSEMSGIINLAALLAISVFVIWIAIESLNWIIAFRITGRKISYLQYLKSFSVLSAIWGVLISIVLYVSISTFFANAMTLSGGAKPESIILDIGLIVAFAVVGYFALISYSLTGTIKEVLKKTVMLSFLKSRVLVAYAMLVAAFLIIFYPKFGLLTILSGIIGILPAIIIGAILLMVFFVFARVYMINVVQTLNKKKFKND